jgi:hypothetical protein
MLLIDETDLEVETLDSVDLLDPQGAGRLADLVPTLQLAALAAKPRESQSPTPDAHPRSGSMLATFTTLAATVLLTTWTAVALAGSSPASPLFPNGLEIAAAEAPPVPNIPTEATVGRIDPVPTPAAELETNAPQKKVAGTFSEKVPATFFQERRIPTSEPRAAVLPTVGGVLIAGDRRIALVGGNLVSVGDKVGAWTITRIDRDGVVVRESGGREVHVAIRMRKPPPPIP